MAGHSSFSWVALWLVMLLDLSFLMLGWESFYGATFLMGG